MHDEILKLIKTFKVKGRAVAIIVLVASLFQYLFFTLVDDLFDLLLLLLLFEVGRDLEVGALLVEVGDLEGDLGQDFDEFEYQEFYDASRSV